MATRLIAGWTVSTVKNVTTIVNGITSLIKTSIHIQALSSLL
ncbi:hypothetical protein [Lacticaseibacillus paracasei]